VNGIETIAWNGTEEVFQFLSTNGGTAWRGWHLTPSPAVQTSPRFGIAGVLTTGDRTTDRLYNDSGVTRTVTGFRGTLATASGGTTVLVDAQIDGTTCFTTQSNRLSLASGANAALASTIQNNSWPSGSYITIGVDQTDGTAAGLGVAVLYTEAA
jgi:hypothetical protein